MPAANEMMAMARFMLVSCWIKVDRLHLATGEKKQREIGQLCHSVAVTLVSIGAVIAATRSAALIRGQLAQ